MVGGGGAGLAGGVGTVADASAEGGAGAVGGASAMVGGCGTAGGGKQGECEEGSEQSTGLQRPSEEELGEPE